MQVPGRGAGVSDEHGVGQPHGPFSGEAHDPPMQDPHGHVPEALE